MVQNIIAILTLFIYLFYYVGLKGMEKKPIKYFVCKQGPEEGHP